MTMERAKQASESIELGIVLALAGGFMDVYSYVARGGVFANAQTGNILLTGVHLSEGDFTLAVRYAVPVICFAVGIMLADLVHERFCSRFHWRQVTVFAEALILLGVSFMSSELDLPANCLTSFACGMQVESFRKIHGHGIATTMCIGNLRSALQSVDDYIVTALPVGSRTISRKYEQTLSSAMVTAFSAGQASRTNTISTSVPPVSTFVRENSPGRNSRQTA